MLRESFREPDLVSNHTPRSRNTAISSVSGDNEKPPFKKKASKSIVEPGFSHCFIGCDFFKHTGRKHFLLDGKINSSQC